MVRLGDPGGERWVCLRDETRPAVMLADGEARTFTARVEPHSEMVFAVGLLENAPATGFVHLKLTLGGREVFAGRFSTKRRGRWFRRTVELEESGSLEFTFRAQHGTARGARLATPEDDEPFVALAMPRVYGPARDTAGRRVLVWISQDTVRADHLSGYGYTRETSPRFDARARDWTVFEQASASASWTLPSMTSQFLSRNPSAHGAVLHDLLPREGLTSIFEALAADGFTVLGITGNELISSSHELARGFDLLLYRNERANVLREQITRALEEWKGGDLAVFAHFMDPHHPYVPPPPFLQQFHEAHEGPEPATHFAELHVIRSPEETAHVLALYDEEIAYTDWVIGGFLDQLEGMGLLHDAVIAYSADHGEEFLDHGGWTHGGALYEEQIRVPLAVRLPGEAPRRVSAPVSLVDLAPTLLEALLVPMPESFEGRSLRPMMRSRGPVAGRSAIAETSLTGDRRPLVSNRRGPYKVILQLSPRGEEDPAIESGHFFDLDADPEERSNLWGSPRGDELAAEVMSYLRAVRASAAAPRPASLSPDAVKKLRAFGYIQ
jgi:arylsulfatase A-like enzyme